MHKKEGLKTFGKLITPSLMEVIGVVSIFVILFIANQIHQLHLEDLTTLGAATFSGTFLSGLAHWLSSLYNSKEFSILAVYIFWLLIALLVYVTALSFTKNAAEILKDMHIRHNLWPKGTNRNNQIDEYIEKFGIRFIVLITLCLYLLKLTPPLVNWWKLHYVVAGVSAHSLSIYLIFLVLAMLYIHGLVVLIRSLILRLRIINI